MKTETKGKLGIYARQSIGKEFSGSIEDQILRGSEVAEKLKMEFELYIDENETAAHDNLDNRPSFVRLLNDIKDGVISSIFVYEESRISRNELTFHSIKQILKKCGVLIYTKQEGIIDYNDSNQEFISGIKNLSNSKFIRDTSDKIKSVLRNNAKNGKASGGATMAYGWKSDDEHRLVHDQEEVQVYLKMRELCLSGMGSGKIAKQLNSMGISTKGRKLYKDGLHVKNPQTQITKKIRREDIFWAPNTVLSILKNPLYKGERHYKGEVYKVPPIISIQQWDELQQAIARNKKFSPRNNKKHLYLLKGLLRCNRCGRNLYGYIKESPGKTQHVYMCSSKRQGQVFCGMRSINIIKLDSLIWNIVSDSDFFIHKVVAEFQSNDILVQVANIDLQISQVEKAIKSLGERRKRRLDLYELEGTMTAEEFKQREVSYESERTEQELLLGNLKDRRVFLSDLKFQEQKLIDFGQKVCKGIAGFDKARRIPVLRELIKDIVVEYDDLNKRHDVDCKLNFGTILAEPPEFFMGLDGSSNYRGPKYNIASFNDKFNSRSHLLFEKYQRPPNDWQENFIRNIATEERH